MQNELRWDGGDRVRGDAGAWDATVRCSTGLAAAAVDGSGVSAALAPLSGFYRREGSRHRAAHGEGRVRGGGGNVASSFPV